MDEEEYRQKIQAKIKEERAQFGEKSTSEILKPLVWEEVTSIRFLNEEPVKQNFLFEDMLPKKLVGGLFGKGGISKSFFLLRVIGISLATGQSFGPFKPTNKFKVLYIGAEDPEEELHRRIWFMAKELGFFNSEDLAKNLAIYSAMGKIEPVIAFDSAGNPITTAYYEWLRRSIENLAGLNVLVLDPLSRFYGLDENNNSHGTAWIRCLEKLSQDYNLNVLFSHHESKAGNQTKSLRDSMGRGASSIREGCRWAISMREMTETDAQRYEVSSRDYIELDISKSNWAPYLPSSIYFKRGLNGLLYPANLSKDRLKHMAEVLVGELSQDEELISRADLQLKRGKGKAIANKLKELVPTFRHNKDIGLIIDYALENGFLFEQMMPEIGKKGPSKKVLKVGFK